MLPGKSVDQRLQETPHGAHEPAGEWRLDQGTWFYRCTCGVELAFPSLPIRPPTPPRED